MLTLLKSINIATLIVMLSLGGPWSLLAETSNNTQSASSSDDVTSQVDSQGAFSQEQNVDSSTGEYKQMHSQSSSSAIKNLISGILTFSIGYTGVKSAMACRAIAPSFWAFYAGAVTYLIGEMTGNKAHKDNGADISSAYTDGDGIDQQVKGLETAAKLKRNEAKSENKKATFQMAAGAAFATAAGLSWAEFMKMNAAGLASKVTTITGGAAAEAEGVALSSNPATAAVGAKSIKVGLLMKVKSLFQIQKITKIAGQKGIAASCGVMENVDALMNVSVGATAASAGSGGVAVGQAAVSYAKNKITGQIFNGTVVCCNGAAQLISKNEAYDKFNIYKILEQANYNRRPINYTPWFTTANAIPLLKDVGIAGPMLTALFSSSSKGIGKKTINLIGSPKTRAILMGVFSALTFASAAMTKKAAKNMENEAKQYDALAKKLRSLHNDNLALMENAKLADIESPDVWDQYEDTFCYEQPTKAGAVEIDTGCQCKAKGTCAKFPILNNEKIKLLNLNLPTALKSASNDVSKMAEAVSSGSLEKAHSAAASLAKQAFSLDKIAKKQKKKALDAYDKLPPDLKASEPLVSGDSIAKKLKSDLSDQINKNNISPGELQGALASIGLTGSKKVDESLAAKSDLIAAVSKPKINTADMAQADALDWSEEPSHIINDDTESMESLMNKANNDLQVENGQVIDKRRHVSIWKRISVRYLKSIPKLK